jgi:hypothetical protein
LVHPASPIELSGGYVGDFLSHVMSHAVAGGVWFTVMNNVNVAGVAVLADVGAVVICEGVQPDRALLERCRDKCVPLLTTQLPLYESVQAAGRIA